MSSPDLSPLTRASALDSPGEAQAKTPLTHGRTYSTFWSGKKVVVEDTEVSVVGKMIQGLAKGKLTNLQLSSYRDKVVVFTENDKFEARDLTTFKTFGILFSNKYKIIHKGEEALLTYLKRYDPSVHEGFSYSEPLRDRDDWKDILRIVESFAREENGDLDQYLKGKLNEVFQQEYVQNYQDGRNLKNVSTYGTHVKYFTELSDPLQPSHYVNALVDDLETIESGPPSDRSEALQKLKDHMDYIAEARRRGVITGEDKKFAKVFAKALPIVMGGLSGQYANTIAKEYPIHVLKKIEHDGFKPDGFAGTLDKVRDDAKLLLKVFEGCKGNLSRSQRKEYQEMVDTLSLMLKIDDKSQAAGELKEQISNLISELGTMDDASKAITKRRIAELIPKAYREVFVRFDKEYSRIYSADRVTAMQNNKTKPDSLDRAVSTIGPEVTTLVAAYNAISDDSSLTIGLEEKVRGVHSTYERMYQMHTDSGITDIHGGYYHEIKRVLDAEPSSEKLDHSVLVKVADGQFEFRRVGYLEAKEQVRNNNNVFLDFIQNAPLTEDERDDYIEMIAKTKQGRVPGGVQELVKTHRKQKDLIAQYETVNTTIRDLLSDVDSLDDVPLNSLTEKIEELEKGKVIIPDGVSYTVIDTGLFSTGLFASKEKRQKVKNGRSMVMSWIKSYDLEDRMGLIEKLLKSEEAKGGKVQELAKAYKEQQKIAEEFKLTINNSYNLKLPESALIHSSALPPPPPLD